MYIDPSTLPLFHYFNFTEKWAQEHPATTCQNICKAFLSTYVNSSPVRAQYQPLTTRDCSREFHNRLAGNKWTCKGVKVTQPTVQLWMNSLPPLWPRMLDLVVCFFYCKTVAAQHNTPNKVNKDSQYVSVVLCVRRRQKR